MKKHLPAVLTGIGLLILWQVIAMCINAAYILPSPTQIAVKIWELREPKSTPGLGAVYGTYSCDNACNAYRTSYFHGSRCGACRCDGAF